MSGSETLPNAASQFPRTANNPKQSAQYWVKEKDRYLRQLLIGDIEDITNRPLVVYFSQLNQTINEQDSDDLAEVLSGIENDEIDLMLQTPGGSVDACEKIVTVLRKRCRKYRVVVPSWAKSAGTVIAISSQEIVMGLNSELGPIDPQWTINGPGSMLVPCQLLAQDPALPQHIREMAKLATQRMSAMASKFLAEGMMAGKSPEDVTSVIQKISNSDGYMSHGAVIDYGEAKELGLNASYLDHNSDLWKRIWLLYCMYDYDTKIRNFGKVFEGRRYSLARSA